MFKFLQSKKGFTIVELVSVLLLLSLGALALANLFTLAFRAFDKSMERYEKQEVAKIVAKYLQNGGAGLGAATRVELYDSTKVLPKEGTSVVGFNYIYINPKNGFLYIRPSGSASPTQLTDVPLYLSFDVVPYEKPAGIGRTELDYDVSCGITCNISVLESDVTINYDETTGKIDKPDSDDLYYSLDVAYHFPNMVENGKLYVNRTMVTADSFEDAKTVVGANTYSVVDKDAIVIKYVSDLTVVGDQLMNDSNFQLYCFIATASYGVNNGEGVVGLLCDFRDNVLLTNPLGEAFVKAYYKLSPPVAEIIAESEPLRAAVRVALKPLIVVAVNALDEDVAHQSAPWFAAFMLCGAGSTAMIIKISKERKKAKAK